MVLAPWAKRAISLVVVLSCGVFAACGGGGGGGGSGSATTPEIVDQARIRGIIPLTYNDCPGTIPVSTLSFDLFMVLSRTADTSTIELKDFSQPAGGLAGYAVGNYSPSGELGDSPDSLAEAFTAGTVYASATQETPLPNFLAGYACSESLSWSFYANGTTIIAPMNQVSRSSYITCIKENAEPIYCSVTYDGVFSNEPA